MDRTTIPGTLCRAAARTRLVGQNVVPAQKQIATTATATIIRHTVKRTRRIRMA